MEISSEKIVIYSNKTVNVIVKNKELELVCDKKTEFLINK